MSDTRQSLSDLADLAGGQPVQGDAPALISQESVTPLREQQIDAQGRAYATGRRKDAVARVWLQPGPGKIEVNGRDQAIYFARPTLRLVINQPFDVADRRGQYDVHFTVTGSGLAGQDDAAKHALAQALTRPDPALRPAITHPGFVTPDNPL